MIFDCLPFYLLIPDDDPWGSKHLSFYEDIIFIIGGSCVD